MASSQKNVWVALGRKILFVALVVFVLLTMLGGVVSMLDIAWTHWGRHKQDLQTQGETVP